MTNDEYIALLHPTVRASAATAIAKANARLAGGPSQVAVTFTLRTIAQQNILYAQGRTNPGPIVTNAKGGQSYHNYGLALDFALLINGKTFSWDTGKDWNGDHEADWMEVVDCFKAEGWEWGGDWVKLKMSKLNDYPHFEKKFGYTWEELLNLVNTGHVDVNNYVILVP